MRPIMNVGTLLLATLLAAAPAAAADLDAVTARADCAQVELAQALGEKVKPDQLEACKARVRKSAPRPPESAMKCAGCISPGRSWSCRWHWLFSQKKWPPAATRYVP